MDTTEFGAILCDVARRQHASGESYVMAARWVLEALYERGCKLAPVEPEKSPAPAITAPIARVREVRQQQQCSLHAAHTIVLQDVMNVALENADTVEDLKPILHRLIAYHRQP